MQVQLCSNTLQVQLGLMSDLLERDIFPELEVICMVFAFLQHLFTGVLKLFAKVAALKKAFFSTCSQRYSYVAAVLQVKELLLSHVLSKNISKNKKRKSWRCSILLNIS